MPAYGTVAYSVVIALLNRLERRGVISHHEALEVLNDALESTEDLGADGRARIEKDIALMVARKELPEKPFRGL